MLGTRCWCRGTTTAYQRHHCVVWHDSNVIGDVVPCAAVTRCVHAQGDFLQHLTHARTAKALAAVKDRPELVDARFVPIVHPMLDKVLMGSTPLHVAAYVCARALRLGCARASLTSSRRAMVGAGTKTTWS